MRCCLMSTWWEIFYEVLLRFLPKMLPGETLCKSAQIFPPKVLVYITKLFHLTDYQREFKQANKFFVVFETCGFLSETQ